MSFQRRIESAYKLARTRVWIDEFIGPLPANHRSRRRVMFADDEPSPMELARLISAVTSDWEVPEALDAAYWLIAQSQLASAHLARLEQAASGAGKTLNDYNRMSILDEEHELDRFLAAGDDWQDPSDVLDPTRNRGRRRRRSGSSTANSSSGRRTRTRRRGPVML